MPKFRKKPIVIEAVRWYPDTPVEGVTEIEVDEHGKPQQVEGLQGAHVVVAGTCAPYDRIKGMVQTLEGPVYADPGDWIITGVKGEKYPCKPDIFEATYDPVDAEEEERPELEAALKAIEEFKKAVESGEAIYPR